MTMLRINSSYANGVRRAIRDLVVPAPQGHGECSGCNECNPTLRSAYIEARLLNLVRDIEAGIENEKV